MMCFLLDHESFQKILSYVSVRVKTINDNRVYNEMHTKNWWWKEQNELFIKVIMILILIVTDKF